MYRIVLDRHPRVPIQSEKSSGTSNTIDTKNTTKGFTLVHSSAIAIQTIKQTIYYTLFVNVSIFHINYPELLTVAYQYMM